VASGEAAGKQLVQIDLAAGGGQGQKVQVVNVDIPFPVSLSMGRVKNIHLIKLLSALRSIFQHGAHGGISVNIGVFTLDVVIFGGFKG